MANWQYTLDIEEAWKQAQEDKLTPQQLATIIADKLYDLPLVGNGKDSVMHNFRNLAANPEADFDDFDVEMEILYDWADTNLTPGKWPPDKLCWIKTCW